MAMLVYRGVICLPRRKSPYIAWPSETNRNPGDLDRWISWIFLVMQNISSKIFHSLVVEPTHLKNISQIRSFSQVGVNIPKKIFETKT